MICKICGSEDLRIIIKKTKRNSYNYFVCNNCDAIFIDENNILLEDSEVERYKVHNNSYNDKSYRDYFHNFICYIDEFIDKRAKILDFGSGPEPVLAKVLKEYNFDIDIYDKFFHKNDSFKNKFYDVVISTEVFEHLKNPLEVFNLLISRLNQNGYLIIMTNFHPKNEDDFLNWWYVRDPTHITFYSKNTFEYIANKFKLKIIKSNEKNIIVLQK